MWVYRLSIVFVYLLVFLLAAFFAGIFLMGLFRWRMGMLLVGANLCYGLMVLWEQVGRNICQSLRRDRDRALARRKGNRLKNDW